MRIEEFLGRLQNVRRTAGGWSARCPAHQDRLNSLSIAWTPPRILIHCFAVCRTDEILGALGLTPRDLFDDPARRPGPPSPAPQYRDALEEQRAKALDAERRAEERREFYQPLIAAADALRLQCQNLRRLRALANKLGPSDIVWDALELVARSETRLNAFEAALDDLLGEGPFRPT